MIIRFALAFAAAAALAPAARAQVPVAAQPDRIAEHWDAAPKTR